MAQAMQREYRLSRIAVALVGGAAVAAIAFRFFDAGEAATSGDMEPMRAIGFAVVFPLALVLFLLRMSPGRTREGMLMRLGTAMQLVLSAASPNWGLHLILGLPVVFLVVELVETRLPHNVREPLVGLFVEVSR